MELRSISAVADDASGSSVVTISPVNLVNLPRTLLTIMCRTEKPTSVCTGSSLQIEQEPALPRGGPARRARLGPADRIPNRPPRPGRAADREGLCRPGEHRARPRRMRALLAVRRADPYPGQAAPHDQRGRAEEP